MTFTYDLTRQPWIPVLMDDGATHELGLRDVLLQAPRIREIAHDSPLFVASIHPLLTAILHRVLGGTSSRQRRAAWMEWWEQGHFDEEAVGKYLQRWADRFDLFHTEHPFYQVAGLEMAEVSPLFRLAMEENNAPAMFANRASPEWRAPSPRLAAQLIVTIQNFALGFGKSSRAKIGGQEIEPPYSADGPLLRGLTIWPSGDTLFQTLMLGLKPHELPRDDAPCWEPDAPHELRDVTVSGARKTTAPRGLCDRLTLQSRLIRLLPQESDVEIIVPAAYFTQGRSLDRDAAGRLSFHPLKVYFESAKAGVLPLSLSEGKASWRNAHALLAKDARDKEPLNALAFTAQLAEDQVLAPGFRPGLNVVGMATEPGKAGKFLLWRHDRMPIPPALLTDANLVEAVKIANEDASNVADEMRSRFATVARVFIAGDRDGGHKPDPDDVKALIHKFDPRRAFWPRLESDFYTLLQRLPSDRAAAIEAWQSALQDAARDCLSAACDALGDSPQAITAVAQIDLRWPFDLKYLRDPRPKKSPKPQPVAA